MLLNFYWFIGGCDAPHTQIANLISSWSFVAVHTASGAMEIAHIAVATDAYILRIIHATIFKTTAGYALGKHDATC
jgi:glycine cleavage system protein P-like pyridoxal-binding family